MERDWIERDERKISRGGRSLYHLGQCKNLLLRKNWKENQVSEHFRPQRPRSFWSEPRIITSGKGVASYADVLISLSRVQRGHALERLRKRLGRGWEGPIFWAWAENSFCAERRAAVRNIGHLHNFLHVHGRFCTGCWPHFALVRPWTNYFTV